MSKIVYPSNYPAENKPLGAWAYYGLDLLYSLPLIGLISAIIFAITGHSNHIKNHAKAGIILCLFKVLLEVLFWTLWICLYVAAYR